MIPTSDRLLTKREIAYVRNMCYNPDKKELKAATDYAIKVLARQMCGSKLNNHVATLYLELAKTRRQLARLKKQSKTSVPKEKLTGEPIVIESPGCPPFKPVFSKPGQLDAWVCHLEQSIQREWRRHPEPWVLPVLSETDPGFRKQDYLPPYQNIWVLAKKAGCKTVRFSSKGTQYAGLLPAWLPPND